MLKGKKILFLCVQFFGYEVAVQKKLEELGADVTYFDERPRNTFWTKALIRLNKNTVKKEITDYYENIWRQIENEDFDYLFVIKAEVTPKWFFEKFKKKNNNAELILFLWDSINNSSNALESLAVFDKKYTFDYDDTLAYDMAFQPLFFIDSYAELATARDFENDLLFVGTAHTDRYMICKQIEKQCAAAGVSSYFYFFLQSPFVYYHKKFFEKGFEKVKKADLSFVSLDTSDTLALYKQSKVILDIQHTRQTGLTMRTLETLGAARKIITTNARVKFYSFYNPENIAVIDRENPSIDVDFFKSDFTPLSEEILYTYSIEGWIESMFFPEKTQFSYLDEEKYKKTYLKESV